MLRILSVFVLILRSIQIATSAKYKQKLEIYTPQVFCGESPGERGQIPLSMINVHTICTVLVKKAPSVLWQKLDAVPS